MQTSFRLARQQSQSSKSAMGLDNAAPPLCSESAMNKTTNGQESWKKASESVSNKILSHRERDNIPKTHVMNKTLVVERKKCFDQSPEMGGDRNI